MHELSLIEGVLRAALDEAARNNKTSVKGIYARLREHGHPMEADHLESLLETLARGTIAEGADIKIEVISPTLRCKDCNATLTGIGGILLCPGCHSSRLELLDADKVDLECEFTE